MQKITVDIDAQRAWVAAVQKRQGNVALFAIDANGGRHALIRIGAADSSWSMFDGDVTSLQLELCDGERMTSWSSSLCPTDLLHVRVDAREQLEVWSGSVPVTKWFDVDAGPDDWPPGLVHVMAADVRSVAALFNTACSATLKSLCLRGAKGLSNLGMVADLTQLESLDLSPPD